VVKKVSAKSKAYRLFESQKFSPRFINHILTVSKEKKVDPILVYALMKQESGFQIDAVSPVGAVGLMQVMPFHFNGLDKWYQKEPYVNTRYGIGILADCLKRSHGHIPQALSLYNSGKKNGYLRFNETKAYVANITKDHNRLKGA
jgi:soluble lytic murein transglycosylase-like protein